MRFDSVPHDLLRRCRQGDLDAFEEFCSAIQTDLYAFLYSMLRDHDDAEEAMQECLVRICRNLRNLNDLQKFPAWLMRIAVNQCHDMRGKAAVREMPGLEEGQEVALELVASAAPPLSPRDAAQRAEMVTVLRSAIEELPPRQRAAIVLFEIEERPIREVAEILECSQGAVKFNLHEARKSLKRLLAARVVDKSSPEADFVVR